MKKLKFLLLLIFSILFSGNQAISQFYEDFSSADEIRKNFSRSSQKKLDKAEKFKQKGDVLMAKANGFHDFIQQSSSIRRGKIRKLEKKALKKQISASLYYESANKKKYRVYKKNFKNARQNADNDADINIAIQNEKEAKNNYKKAKRLRRKASNKSNNTKAYKLLSDAYDLELLAFQNQENAYETYLGITQEPAVEYIEYVEYIEPDDAETLELSTDSAITEEFFESEISPVDSSEYEEPLEEPVLISKPPEIVFSVQIIACIAPFDQSQIEYIYKGSHPTKIIHENDWYKCHVGNFNSYDEAKYFKEQSNLLNAFIVAYKDGQKISVGEAIKQTK